MAVEPGTDVSKTALVKVNPQTDKAVIALYEQALKLQEYADALVINSDSSNKDATNDLSIISGLKKAIEEERKGYTQPINEHLKAVNEAFAVFVEPLVYAGKITKDKMLAYNAEVDRKRAMQEEINQQRLEAAQKEMGLTGELSESVNLVEVTPKAPTTIRTDMGSAGLTACWKYEVTDFALLPDEFKLPDTTMLNSIAKKHHDQKQIPGVRFYNEPGITVRTK